jgi:hypothetical protein
LKKKLQPRRRERGIKMSIKDIFAPNTKNSAMLSKAMKKRKEEEDTIPMIRIEFVMQKDGNSGCVEVMVSDPFKELCDKAESNATFNFERDVRKVVDDASQEFSEAVSGMIAKLVLAAFSDEDISGAKARVVSSSMSKKDLKKVESQIEKMTISDEEKEDLKKNLKKIMKRAEEGPVKKEKK